MRPEALRPATATAAASSTTKLSTRLSKGEKRNRKRLAQVGAVYDADPVVRTPADILARGQDTKQDTDPEQPAQAPVAKNKWLTASITDDAATVVGRIFDEADRRDPTHARTWIALVDGNNHQIDRIQAEATQRGIDVTILCDFIHVLEYLWKAVGWPSWSFHQEGDPTAEEWVHDQATAVLQGKATRVAAGLRRAATRRGLDPPQRRCRRLRHLPDQQGALPGLSDRAAQRLADRHRRHRRRLPPPRQRPHGHHRSPLGTVRCRGHPQSSEPSAATATSTPTGATTSRKNAAASTNPATSTDTSRRPRDHSGRPAPKSVRPGAGDRIRCLHSRMVAIAAHVSPVRLPAPIHRSGYPAIRLPRVPGRAPRCWRRCHTRAGWGRPHMGEAWTRLSAGTGSGRCSRAGR